MSDETTQAPAEAGGRLSGNLGVGHIAAMVIATASPLGVMGGVAAFAMAFGNGYAVAATYLIIAILMLAFAYTLSRVTPFVRNAGAFFSYVGHGLGPMAGVATAAMAWIVYYAVLVLVYAYVGLQLDAAVQMLGGPAISWWIYTFLVMALIAYMGYHRIDLTTRVLAVTLTIEVLLIVIVDVAVTVQGGAEGLHGQGFLPSAIFPDGSGFAIAAMFCAMSFIGFEATAVFRDEARDPDRTVPRATYIAVIFIGVLYAGSAWALSMAFGRDDLIEAGSMGAPVLLGAASTFVGALMADIIQVLLVTALFATALSFHNILARYLHTLARANLIPTGLAQVHPRHRAPSNASATMTLISGITFVLALVAGLDPIRHLATWGNGLSGLGFFILLTTTTASVFVFLIRQRTVARPSPLAYSITALGTIAFGALVYVAVANFGALAGGDTALAFTLIAIFPALATLAVVRALVLKKRSPERYAAVHELISSP
ncbi:APC family permease [Aeromicrobium sp. YIM 150415]|uniref:APC family permease n=1 Tax=Aeromicrobium sp. YIM 150415 TaxID=2803912 RepID=UPI001963DA4F|nr:APC family permease [Aeromicrobium sp. YIM 150415]MBM9462108.1 APC family permease [Aeromicrobium sp. YIM 150415]